MNNALNLSKSSISLYKKGGNPCELFFKTILIHSDGTIEINLADGSKIVTSLDKMNFDGIDSIYVTCTDDTNDIKNTFDSIEFNYSIKYDDDYGFIKSCN